jgi:hypothetical protein
MADRKMKDRKMADLGNSDPINGHRQAPTSISLILTRIISAFRISTLMARRLVI